MTSKANKTNFQSNIEPLVVLFSLASAHVLNFSVLCFVLTITLEILSKIIICIYSQRTYVLLFFLLSFGVDIVIVYVGHASPSQRASSLILSKRSFINEQQQQKQQQQIVATTTGAVATSGSLSKRAQQDGPLLLSKTTNITAYEQSTIVLPCDILNLPVDMHVSQRLIIERSCVCVQVTLK